MSSVCGANETKYIVNPLFPYQKMDAYVGIYYLRLGSFCKGRVALIDDCMAFLSAHQKTKKKCRSLKYCVLLAKKFL